jgi:hypothetical protein
VFPVKHFYHGLLVDFHHGAIGHCGCGGQAERLACKATFSKEIVLVQNTYCGFLSDFDTTASFYLSLLYIKNRVGRIALGIDRLLLGKSFDLSTAVDGGKERLGIEFADFLGSYHGCHELAPSQEFQMRRRANLP